MNEAIAEQLQQSADERSSAAGGWRGSRNKSCCKYTMWQTAETLCGRQQRHYMTDSRSTIWQTADLPCSRQHVYCYLCLDMLVLLLERLLFLRSPVEECIMCLSCSARHEFGFIVMAIHPMVYSLCVHTSKQATCTAKLDVQFEICLMQSGSFVCK